MKKIILTGGGTAGHVTPNLALVPRLTKDGYEIVYVGAKNGMEKKLAEAAGLRYVGISAGKLRRYLNIKNLTDVFAVLKGCADALGVVRKEKPSVVFSKGGFVTVPVVAAAKLCGVPVVLHESDITPGLANRLSLPFARAVCCAFPEAAKKIPRAIVTGSPIRGEIFNGDKEKGLKICGFNKRTPVLLVIGGSSGSKKINACVRGALRKLQNDWQVVHVCGAGNIDAGLNAPGYKQFEFLSAELPHVMAAADCVVSRAGANSIFEFLALAKPNLLIPLGLDASRGDQILNTKSFEERGFSKVLNEENLNEESLTKAVWELNAEKEKYTAKMKAAGVASGVDAVCEVIEKYAKD